MTTFPRHTIREKIELSGLGLHTGAPVNVILHPSDKGIAFRYGSTRTPAIAANVTDTTRSTKLGEVGTIEHAMSAFAGLEITDIEVEVDAPEMPGLDGSAWKYVEAILATGRAALGTKEVPTLFTRVFLQEEGGLKAAIAKGVGHWRYEYRIDDRWPNEQVFEAYDAVADYVQQIAKARTFALAEEIPLIIQHGLGRGLDENSALILGIEGYKNPARFPDEPARHKLLDLIGDLYLSGLPIRALDVVAEKTGHRTNVKLAAMVAQAVAS